MTAQAVIEHPAAPEHRKFRFHVVIALNQATSPLKRRSTNARSGKVSASFRHFWRVVLQLTGLLVDFTTICNRRTFSGSFLKVHPNFNFQWWLGTSGRLSKSSRCRGISLGVARACTLK
jgi:hypothetical protein